MDLGTSTWKDLHGRVCVPGTGGTVGHRTCRSLQQLEGLVCMFCMSLERSRYQQQLEGSGCVWVCKRSKCWQLERSVFLECQQQNCITMANNKCFSRCVRFNASPRPSSEPFAAKETPRTAGATHSSCPWKRCLQAPSRAPRVGQGKDSSRQLSLGTAGSSSQVPGPGVILHPF